MKGLLTVLLESCFMIPPSCISEREGAQEPGVPDEKTIQHISKPVASGDPSQSLSLHRTMVELPDN